MFSATSASSPQNASKRKLATGRVTEISWTGAGEDQLQVSLGLELIKWCETPSPDGAAAASGGGAGAGVGGAVGASTDSEADDGPAATSTQEDPFRRDAPAIVVSGDRYERVQAAAAHGMLASLGGLDPGKIKAALQQARKGRALDNVSATDCDRLTKQPRFQRKQRVREVKGTSSRPPPPTTHTHTTHVYL